MCPALDPIPFASPGEVLNRRARAAQPMTTRPNGRKIAQSNKGGSRMDVLWCAPQGLFGDAFSGSLSKLEPGIRVGRCDPIDVISAPYQLSPKLVVVDLDAVTEAPAEVVLHWCHRFPSSPVVALASRLEDEYIAAILGAGARAFLPKSYSEEQALGVLKLALSGGSHRPSLTLAPNSAEKPTASTTLIGGGDTQPYGLTERELEVLAYVCEGYPNAEIAKRLDIRVGTTKIHLNNCYRKMCVQNRAQAMRLAERFQYIQRFQEDRSSSSGAVRDWLLRYMSSQACRKGAVLFRKGEPGRVLYYLQEGRVRLLEIDKEMGPEELFGEIGIFSRDATRTCSAQCETDVRLLSLTADQAKRLYFENPEFAYHVTLLISQRLREDQQRAH